MISHMASRPDGILLMAGVVHGCMWRTRFERICSNHSQEGLVLNILKRSKGLVAVCHSFCLFIIFFYCITYIQSSNHMHTIHSPRPLSISSSLDSSVGQTSLWCRAENRIRACLPASRRATNWATPHHNWATPHHTEPRRTSSKDQQQRSSWIYPSCWGGGGGGLPTHTALCTEFRIWKFLLTNRKFSNNLHWDINRRQGKMKWGINT
jgi:hypothetical protein